MMLYKQWMHTTLTTTLTTTRPNQVYKEAKCGMIQQTLKVLHVYRVRLLLLVRASARYRGHLVTLVCLCLHQGLKHVLATIPLRMR